MMQRKGGSVSRWRSLEAQSSKLDGASESSSRFLPFYQHVAPAETRLFFILLACIRSCSGSSLEVLLPRARSGRSFLNRMAPAT